MKKLLILSLTCFLLIAFFISCQKKVEETPPPPPQVKEQPKVEKVEKPPIKPVLTEEEIFAKKTLEELNAEEPMENIYFDYNKFFVREDAKPVLEDNAAYLKKWPSVTVLVEGHCDERGTEEYNMSLGEKRAKAAYDFLVSLGVSPDRIKTISYGKSQPLDPGHNEIAWQKNRRCEFTIIAK